MLLMVRFLLFQSVSKGHTMLCQRAIKTKIQESCFDTCWKTDPLTEHHDKNLSEKDYRDLTDQIMLNISVLSGKRYSHVGKMDHDLKPAV